MKIEEYPIKEMVSFSDMGDGRWRLHCELEPSLLRKMKRGMRGSMIPKGCHSNVRILVERDGGKQLVGYVVCKESEKLTFQIYWPGQLLLIEGPNL